MKSRKNNIYILFLSILFLCPTAVFAVSYNTSSNVTSKLINFNSIISSGAIVNNVSSSNNNFSLIIVGLIVIILILIGIAMFSPKK